MGSNTSLLHVVSSYPDCVGFQTINNQISSCQVLIKDHLETMHRDKTIQPPSSLALLSPGTGETPKLKKRRSRTSSTTEVSTPATPMSLNSSVEAIGRIEEPAVIQIQPQTQQPQQQPQQHQPPKPHAEKVRQKSESTSSPKKSSATKLSAEVSGTLSKVPQIKPTTKTQPKKLKTAKVKKTTIADLPQLYPKLEPHVDAIYDSLKTLHNIWEADETTPGWAFYQNKDGVVVHRKAATGEEGTFPADVCKGKTQINVPLNFLTTYIKDLDNRPEYDSMYESGRIIEELGDSASTTVHLVFKNLFMVTGRDFCSLSSWRHITGNLYGLMNKGIVHPECPEQKSKVS